jgi:ribosomal protein S14
MATTTTTDGNSSSNNNNNQDTSVWAISENCVRCGRQYVDYIRDPDVSLCDVCFAQELFGDGESASSSAVVDSSTSNSNTMESAVLPNAEPRSRCQCGVELNDSTAGAHETMCGICQDLFGDSEPTSSSTAVDTTTAAATVAPAGRPLHPGQISCRNCGRPFRPDVKLNNDVDCSHCCNRKAGEGFDWWKREGLAAPTRVRRAIADFQQGPNA